MCEHWFACKLQSKEHSSETAPRDADVTQVLELLFKSKPPQNRFAANPPGKQHVAGSTLGLVGYASEAFLKKGALPWDKTKHVVCMSVMLQKRFLDVIVLAGKCSAACEASFSGFLLSSNAEPAVLHLRSPSTLLLAPRRLPGRPPANKFDQALRQRAFILKGCCYGNGISTIQDQMLAFRLTAGWSVLGQCKASIKLARTPECKVKLQAQEA